MIGVFPRPTPPLIRHRAIKDVCPLCLDWSLPKVRTLSCPSFEPLSYLTHTVSIGKGLLTNLKSKAIPSLSYHHTLRVRRLMASAIQTLGCKAGTR